MPGKEDNFDALYCNKPDEFDLKTYEYHLTRVNNEKHFDEFYYDSDEENKSNQVTQERQQKPFILENVQIEIKNIQNDKYADYTNKVSVSGNTNSNVLRVADTTLSLLNRNSLKDGGPNQSPYYKQRSNKDLIHTVEESSEKDKKSVLGKSY